MMADQRSSRILLWVAVMVITVVAVALLILVLGHWWPPGNSWYLPAVVAVLLLGAMGAAWGIGSLYEIWRHRRWAWWMLAWPIVTALGVTLAFAGRPDFEDVRPEFEATARELLATPETDSLSDLKIGRFEVERVYDSQRGAVFFIDERTTGFTTESGWVYSPDGVPSRPSRNGEFTTEHLDDAWYRYELVTNF